MIYAPTDRSPLEADAERGEQFMAKRYVRVQRRSAAAIRAETRRLMSQRPGTTR